MNNPNPKLEVVRNSDAVSQLESRLRADSYVNTLTGIGSSIDKRLGGRPIVDYLDYYECADLYRSNDMAARIVDAPAEEMCRRGWEFIADDDKDLSKAVSTALEELETKKHIKQGIKWKRAFGGAGLFIGVDDGQPADQPVDLKRIKKIDFLLPLDPSELVANDYYQDSLKPKYGRPMNYRINRFGSGVAPYPSSQNIGVLQQLKSMLAGGAKSSREMQWNFLPIVHESRIIRFDGIFINRVQLRENRYWGDPIFFQCNAVLRDFDLSWSSASILLQDFAQAVIKLPGFSALLAKNGPSAFAQAAQMVETSRSTARAIFLDIEDDFERKATPTTGLPELLQMFFRRLAASADMPMSRLVGDSPRGFNASGETDETWWYDKMAAKQQEDIHPALKTIITYLLAAKQGPANGKTFTPLDWKIAFHPLKQLSDLQEADRRFRLSQADAVGVGAGIYTPEEVALTRSGGAEFDGGKIQLLEKDARTRKANRLKEAKEMGSVQKKGGQQKIPPAEKGNEDLPNVSGGPQQNRD